MNKALKKNIDIIANIVRSIVFGRNNKNNFHLVDKVRNELNVKVLYSNSNLADGYIEWDFKHKVPKIVLYRYVSYRRQIFTLAHELGHLFIHWKWAPGKDLTPEADSDDRYGILDIVPPRLYRGSNIENPKQEAEANEFAGSFLMPAKSVKHIYSKSKSKNLDDVKFIVSNRFGVSNDAAYIRLSHLYSSK